MIDPRLVSFVAPNSVEADHYRGLRHVVETTCRSQRARLLAVTSPVAGDGKTVTAINLAGALAQSRQLRVLLIDLDLRRPAIGRMLGHTGEEAGLLAALGGPERWLDAPPRTFGSVRLHVIPASPVAGRVYDALADDRLATLLERVAERFDYVILDTPPIVPVPDSRQILQWVDKALLVVSAGKTPRKMVDEALALVDSDKLLGIVFNGEERRRSRYARYYYGYR